MSRWSTRIAKARAAILGGFRNLSVETVPSAHVRIPLAAHRGFWAGPSEDADLFAFLAGAMPDDGVFLDIGANIGVYTLAIAALRRGRLRGVAFEPVPSTHRILEHSIRLNGIHTVRAERLALSSARGTLRLSAFAGGRNNFIVPPSWRSGPTVDVPAVPLDEFLREHPELMPHAVKIDVEGFELDVLRGGRETFASCKPALVVECHCASWPDDGIGREIERLLRSFGYVRMSDRRGGDVCLPACRKTIHLLCS